METRVEDRNIINGGRVKCVSRVPKNRERRKKKKEGDDGRTNGRSQKKRSGHNGDGEGDNEAGDGGVATDHWRRGSSTKWAAKGGGIKKLL